MEIGGLVNQLQISKINKKIKKYLKYLSFLYAPFSYQKLIRAKQKYNLQVWPICFHP